MAAWAPSGVAGEGGVTCRLIRTGRRVEGVRPGLGGVVDGTRTEVEHLVLLKQRAPLHHSSNLSSKCPSWIERVMLIQPISPSRPVLSAKQPCR